MFPKFRSASHFFNNLKSKKKILFLTRHIARNEKKKLIVRYPATTFVHYFLLLPTPIPILGLAFGTSYLKEPVENPDLKIEI